MNDSTEFFTIKTEGKGADRYFEIIGNDTPVGLPSFTDANAAYDACDRLNELANEIADAQEKKTVKQSKPRAPRGPKLTDEQNQEVSDYVKTEGGIEKRGVISLAMEKFGITRSQVKNAVKAG